MVFPEFVANKTLKDPEKIKADLENKKQDYIDESALFAERGYIVVIGIFDEARKTTFLEGDEKTILKAFWKLWSDTTGAVIGHNIKGFDIPFLMRRSWLNGIPAPAGVIRGRYLTDRIIDTMELWSCGNYRETISLNNLAIAFGLPGKNGNGKDFAGQYMLGGDYRKKALEYLKNDLFLTHTVALGMGVVS
jgi:predicted PolB exonuclease-like 3'-5' exonuclease